MRGRIDHIALGPLIAASLAAPAVAVTLFHLGLIGVLLATTQATLPAIAMALLSYVYLIALCTVWGAIPAFVCGGTVLILTRKAFQRPDPSIWTTVTGGLAAVILYMAISFGLWAVDRGLPVVIAPWVSLVFAGPQQSGLNPETPGAAWLLISLLLSGPAAARVYVSLRRAKRA